MTNLLETVYVPLLNEGTPVSRPTHAERIDGNGNRYKLLSPANYDSLDEEWQFPPNTIVRCERKNGVLIAVEEDQAPTETK
jgi:hypothetical protein